MNAPYHHKALPEGSILREWKLERVLGVGGFGIVYQGRSLYFDEQVAIKEYFPSAISDRVDDTTVTPSDSSSEEIYALGLQKFLEEAKVLWNLSKPQRHPNIVCVKSLFEIHGTAYIVMDFESGVSLSQMLKDGRTFDEVSLLALVRPIAEGLDRAHRAGVLHRDIKPANVLVDDTGRPVLIDFGSARFESGQATSTKVTFYTPPYAAIEQYVRTYPQGPWTDIYALGVTLYECVTGRKPLEVLERLHGDEDEPLAAKTWPGFSATFVRAVDAAMAIKPADRPQSIPQWLRMFEADSEPAPADFTRASGFIDEPPMAAASAAQSSLEPKAPTPPPPPPASETVDAPTTAKRPSRGVLIGGVAGAAVLAAVALGLTLRPSHAPKGGASLAASGSPAASLAAESVSTAAAPDYAGDFDALISDARKAGRGPRDLAALAGAKDKVAAIVAQLRSQAGKPEAAGLSAERDQIAIRAAQGEGAALVRDADAQLRDVLKNPAWLSAQGKGGAKVAVVAAAVRARGALNAGVADIAHSDGPTKALEAARGALASYQSFSQALLTAQPALIAAQKTTLETFDSTGRQIAADITAKAGGRKPWLFSSKAAKDAYKQSQDNIAKAKARSLELHGVFESAQTATDLKALNAATAKASEIVTDLQALRTSTAEAIQAQGAPPGSPTAPSKP